jgi:hypothetical protein
MVTFIQNAAIVGTRDGSIARNMTIVLQGDRIQTITPASTVQVDTSARVVDVSGKYVVPGFLDMHAHAVDAPLSDFAVLLANGVTGIRQMSGSPDLIQRARALNADISMGRLDGPEVLIMPSDIFVGVQARTAAEAAQFVQQKKTDGADFIKIVAGSRDVFLAVLEEARRLRLPAAGHLAPTVTAREASAAGFHFEHLGAGLGLLLECTSDEADIRQELMRNPPPPPTLDPRLLINPRLSTANWLAPVYQRIAQTYSAARCEDLSAAFLADRTWQTPTLIRIRTSHFGDDPQYRRNPNLKYVDKTRQSLWKDVGQEFTDTVTPAARSALSEFYAMCLQVVNLMQHSGVKMLAGSDLGGGWLIPGFSLHQEFHELAAAGLSPLEILQMTTLNGAEFIGRQSSMGTVEPGKTADLVVLDGNPIEDVSSLDRISAVFLKGRYFSDTALEQLKRQAAASYASADAG